MVIKMKDTKWSDNLKNELLTEINKIDFSVLKENYNRLLFRQKHTLIEYEDDEYADISFFNKEMFGDDVYLKNELLKQVQYTIKGLTNAPYDEQKKINILLDEFSILIQAIGISLGLQPETYQRRLNQKIYGKNKT